MNEAGLTQGGFYAHFASRGVMRAEATQCAGPDIGAVLAALAAAVGPSAGSFVINHFGWPWAFYINLTLGGLALWRGAWLLQECEGSTVPGRVDGMGMALLMLAVGSVTLATGLIAAGAFVAWARHAQAPLVDLALFNNPTYRYVNLATLAFGTAFSKMFLTFIFFMMSVWR